ncbi:hypothetical protein C7999DRAFT_32752 [Corynascus novoguineensis]|uniref:Uncharacterized protein n=1 Tax=Corynascus novoguineensis TaxID=1126955 RepID=A0AAN7CRB1_9PEZI|nr:hypothetical protein C7999DRAFT_32752 [Corynascus novoguineensis]
MTVTPTIFTTVTSVTGNESGMVIPTLYMTPVISSTNSHASIMPSALDSGVGTTPSSFKFFRNTAATCQKHTNAASSLDDSYSMKTYSIIPTSGLSSRTAPIPSTSPDPGSNVHRRYVRTGFYNAELQKAEGMAFLGNYGGQGSGKWTPYDHDARI